MEPSISLLKECKNCPLVWLPVNLGQILGCEIIFKRDLLFLAPYFKKIGSFPEMRIFFYNETNRANCIFFLDRDILWRKLRIMVVRWKWQISRELAFQEFLHLNFFSAPCTSLSSPDYNLDVTSALKDSNKVYFNLTCRKTIHEIVRMSKPGRRRRDGIHQQSCYNWGLRIFIL